MTDTQRADVDGWAEVSARIVQGFTHEINNRLVALMGAADLLGGDGSDGDLLELLRIELSRLEAANRRLRDLVAWEPQVEAVPLRVLVEDTLDLHRRHRGLDGVVVRAPEFDAATPAVEAVVTAVRRGLLVLLGHAAEEAGRAGEPVVVEAGPDPGQLRIRPAPAAEDAFGEVADWLERGGAILRWNSSGAMISFSVAGEGLEPPTHGL